MPERNPPRDPKIPEATDPGQSREAVSASVQVGQIFEYLGPDAKHLISGDRFKIKEVDDERQMVRIVTAKEEANAAREQRPPQTYLVNRNQWENLPKQLDHNQGTEGA